MEEFFTRVTFLARLNGCLLFWFQRVVNINWIFFFSKTNLMFFVRRRDENSWSNMFSWCILCMIYWFTFSEIVCLIFSIHSLLLNLLANNVWFMWTTLIIEINKLLSRNSCMCRRTKILSISVWLPILIIVPSPLHWGLSQSYFLHLVNAESKHIYSLGSH